MKDYQMVQKFEIQTKEGNFIQVGETNDRAFVQIVISTPLPEKGRMETAIALLTKDQWEALCDTRYKIKVEYQSYEEPSDESTEC